MVRITRCLGTVFMIAMLSLMSGAVCIADQRQVSQIEIVRDSSKRVAAEPTSQRGTGNSAQVSQNEVILPSLKKGVFVAPKLVSEDLSKICESEFASLAARYNSDLERNNSFTHLSVSCHKGLEWKINTPAWSPDGKHIAFTATPSLPGDVLYEGGSGIWIADVADLDRAPKVSSLVKAPNKMYSPGYPFWISPDEIGWCDDFTDDQNNHFLSFYHSSVLKPHVEPLGARRFLLYEHILFPLPLLAEQVRGISEDTPPSKGCGGVIRISVMPDDLYWDSKERCIAFSAHRDEADSQLIMNELLARGSIRSDGSTYVYEECFKLEDRLRSEFPQKVAIWIYDPWNEKAKQVCIPTDSMRSSEISEQSQVSFWGLPTSAEKLFLIQCKVAEDLCIKGRYIIKGWNITSGLWMREGQNTSFDNYRLIAKDDDLRFPRMSPKGDAIVWISTGTSGMSSQEKDAVNFADRGVHLWVMKISKDGKRTVRRLSEKLSGFPDQCPFCWSPDGKSIAYTDGKKICIVDI